MSIPGNDDSQTYQTSNTFTLKHNFGVERQFVVNLNSIKV